MAINGITGYSPQMALTELLANKKENNAEAGGLLSSAAGSGSSSIASYMLNNSEALKGVFDEISKLTGGPVTFTALREYQAELQRQFNEAIREDLLLIGVPADTEFTLASDGQGGIRVLCGDAESRARIEAYFEVNPEMADVFNRLQTLSNLDKARKEQGYTAEDIKTRIQLESLAQWWANEGTDYSQYMYFNDYTTIQFLGISNRV
jgi:hypothetical protein